MPSQRPPFWFWRFDRWNVLVSALLALLALVLALRMNGAPTKTPEIQAPTPAQAAQLAGQPFELTGAAAPGAKVQLFDGDTLLGETTADASGNWKFAAPALAAGPHTLVAKAFDASGKALGASQPTQFELPKLTTPEIKLANLPDLEAGAPFDLTGTAAPGAKVQLFDGDTLLGETTADASGNWKFAVPALAGGSHNLVAKAFDASGKALGASQPFKFEAPEVTRPAITPPRLPDLKAGAPFELTGTAAPGAKIQVFDGDTLLGETTADASGNWKFAAPVLAAGPHSLVTKTQDAAGKALGESEPVQFELPEVTRPAITPPSLPDLKAGAPFELTGTAAPGAKIQVFDGDTLLGETTADASGNWKFAAPALAAGPHSLVTKTQDAAGNALGASEPFQFELPEVTRPAITPPSLPDLKAGAPFELTGTAAPGAKIQVFDGDTLLGETTADASGNWKFAAPALAAGPHSLVTKTQDAAGKALGASEPFQFELPEVTRPAITPPSLPDLKAGAPFELTGTAAPGAKIQVFDGDTLLGETTADASGNWKFTAPALAAGPHTLVTKTLDAAGKALGASEPVQFELPEAPVAPAASYPAPYVVTLAPGASTSVPVRGFCLNYGKPFPGTTLQGADLASDRVRSAIAYALQKGYVDSDPLQVQLAVWTLQDGKKIPGRTYTLADEIIRFAESGAAPEPADAQTLAAALGKSLVSASIGDYQSTSPANYQYKGKGTLVLTNTSKDTLTLVLPYGMRFTDSGQRGAQDMAIFPAAPQP